MSKKTIDEMKSELEAGGYSVRWIGSFWGNFEIGTPDEWELSSKNIHRELPQAHTIYKGMIQQAYDHLQERRELEVLREFVLESGSDYLDIHDPSIGEYVSDEADKLIERFNITADESDNDET